MARPLQLLIVEDNPDDAALLLAGLRRAGYDPVWTQVETLHDFITGIAEQPEIIVCDYCLPTMTAPEAMAILRERNCDIPLIVVSGTMDEDTRATALREGAADVLLKDDLTGLRAAIDDVLAARQ